MFASEVGNRVFTKIKVAAPMHFKKWYVLSK